MLSLLERREADHSNTEWRITAEFTGHLPSLDTRSETPLNLSTQSKMRLLRATRVVWCATAIGPWSLPPGFLSSSAGPFLRLPQPADGEGPWCRALLRHKEAMEETLDDRCNFACVLIAKTL